MMPDDTQVGGDTPRPQKMLSISGIDFPVNQPYVEGTITLSKGEASALNQVRKENLGNNFRGAVKKAIEDNEKANGKDATLPDSVIAELQTAFAKLDGEYEFSVANVAARAKLDPVEREVRSLIKEALRSQLSSENPPRKVSDLSDDEVEAIIAANSDNEAIVSLAKTRVAEKQKVASFSLSSATAPQPDNG